MNTIYIITRIIKNNNKVLSETIPNLGVYKNILEAEKHFFSIIEDRIMRGFVIRSKTIKEEHEKNDYILEYSLESDLYIENLRIEKWEIK
jgi:hypothetical protein